MPISELQPKITESLPELKLLGSSGVSRASREGWERGRATRLLRRGLLARLVEPLHAGVLLGEGEHFIIHVGVKVLELGDQAVNVVVLLRPRGEVLRLLQEEGLNEVIGCFLLFELRPSLPDGLQRRLVIEHFPGLIRRHLPEDGRACLR